MHDLTEGPVRRHLIAMAVPTAIGMLMQTLYYLVDLYFVGRLGDAALAGVGAAGTVMMVVIAMTQVLGVGTVALIAQAVGRKDAADANLVFNQSLLMAAGCALFAIVAGYGLSGLFMGTVGADAATTTAGVTYLHWFLPGMALQFALVAMGSALRGTGIVKPTMVVQMATVLLNVVLAPVLIAGWGTGHPMGVARCGPCQHRVRRFRRHHPVPVFPPSRAIRGRAPRPAAAAPRDLATPAQHRAALGRRVPADVRDHGRHLRDHPELRA